MKQFMILLTSNNLLDSLKSSVHIRTVTFYQQKRVTIQSSAVYSIQQLVMSGLKSLIITMHWCKDISGRPWCDFVVYTKKGLSIQHIVFDENFG